MVDGTVCSFLLVVRMDKGFFLTLESYPCLQHSIVVFRETYSLYIVGIEINPIRSFCCDKGFHFIDVLSARISIGEQLI